jgi:hypothetical protein
MERMQKEGVSTGLADFFARLSPEERKDLVALLREPQTYIAEDMGEVLAILREVEG